MKCATHPEVETNLTCGRCERPICPKCMVQTPVGPRCPDCAGLKRLPTYQVLPRQYLIASGAGLGVAIATGFAWAYIPFSGYFFYFSLLIGLGVGYAIGEVISRSVNRKRGRSLQAIGGTCMVISYVISNLFPEVSSVTLFFSLSGLLALALGIIIAIIRLR